MTDDETDRREFRAWVRAHHPDAGGDPEEFAAALAIWRERLRGRAAVPAADVTVFRSRRGLWLVRRWWRRRRRGLRTGP